MAGATTPRRPRYALVDAVRGAAIIGVVFYHLAWDLRYLDFITTNVDVHPIWFSFARTLLATFLVLTGVSLVLAHGEGMRWPAFLRRLGVLAAAAALVTIGTYFAFPDAFVYFGVLHAIALFSLMAVPFLRAPIWFSIGVAAVVIVTPFLHQSPAFNAKALSWLGFWTVPPLTQDLVPVFPGFGYTLAGLAGMRLVLWSGLAERVAAIRADRGVMRFLSRAGRWSLVIYLVHQPILLGVLVPLASVVQPGAGQRAVDFIRSCAVSCNETRGDAAYCEAYCQCALDVVTEENMWAAINSPEPTDEQRQSVGQVINLCSALAGEEEPPRE